MKRETFLQIYREKNWRPIQPRVKPPADQQSADDFIAKGGKVIRFGYCIPTEQKELTIKDWMTIKHGGKNAKIKGSIDS